MDIIITGHDYYLDGGTFVFDVEGSDRSLCVDFEFGTDTPGSFWWGDPREAGSERITDPNVMGRFIAALIMYRGEK
ncbi:MAG: hypothetical protein ACXABY_01290 [Candidatus Thorarchaeota archaeon]|jgi:hypothetical protein